MNEKTRLFITVPGDIIFGYPPTLPPCPEIILGGKIYENKKPFQRFRQHACKTYAKVKRSFTRTGVRASDRI